MPRLTPLLQPRSLLGRVFSLYTLAMVLFVGVGLGLFYRFQFTVQLAQTQTHADTLSAVAAPAVADAAVIGDYDTIQNTLERLIRHSMFASAQFIDLKGGVVRASHEEGLDVAPPGWLAEAFADQLYDINVPVTVGGRDYGVMRLSFAPERIAGALWQQTRYALWLAFGGLLCGLLLIRWPLKRWLGNLDRIRSLEADIRAGTAGQQAELAQDAPIEFRQTFEVLNQAAATLQTQREQAEVTLRAIGDGVLTLDRNGRIVMANPAASHMWATDAPSLLGRPAPEVLPEIFQGRSSLKAWTGERCQVQRGGRSRTLDTTLTVVRNPGADEVAGYVLACRDITVQHALDQQLRNEIHSREQALTALRGVLEGLLPGSTPLPKADGPQATLQAISGLIATLVTQMQARGEQLSAIFALSADGFISFDEHRNIRFVSSAVEALTGLDEAQLLGQDEATLLRLLSRQAPGEAPPPDLTMLREVQADGSARRVRLALARPARRVLELGLNQSHSGSVSQVLHLRDITHEIEVDRLKSEFLSTAAHELRTPMTSIHGFVELMLARPMNEEKRTDVLRTVQRQTTLMIAILNELLDLARIEARQGKDFKLERLDLIEVVRDAIKGFSPPVARPAPQLSSQLQGPSQVRIDRLKMLQALGNVLSNAYKYSGGGGDVRVRVVERLVPPAGRLVGVQVEDEGIGMTPEQLARVTERFYRADASGNIPGTGLGMAIVKEVVELQGGRLELASEAGRGTTVTLWLPEAVSTGDTVPMPL